MKKIILALGCLLPVLSQAQQAYWQQEVDYKIGVTLNEKEHSIKGQLQLDYTNHAPEKLDYIWFHLWPNAYKNENTAYARQILREKDGQKRWEAMKEKGYMDSLYFTAGGKALRTEADPEHIDVIKVYLPAPLASGEKITISTPFYVKLPTYNSRSGFNGDTYIVCQWYPKPAVYDRKGWHPMPYFDQGEFYSEFGTFDVSITVPSSFIVGATGTLQNEDELAQYRAMGSANVAAGSRKNKVKYVLPAAPQKTLRYTGGRIHDFAWFADPGFVVRYDTLALGTGKPVDVFTFHHPDGNRNWSRSTDYVKSAVQKYSAMIGTYPYPVVQAVEGPTNEMSGGMEYPMITLITSPKADEETLDAVIAHEVGHNWFQGILGSNERRHAWLDEGLNTYFQFYYEAEKYRSNSIFGKSLPSALRQQSIESFQSIVYNAMNRLPMEQAIDIPSGDFPDKETYGIVTYIKTALWMYALEHDLGRENLMKGMQAYFNEWKFRHPYPEDLKQALEKETGKSLDEYFRLLHKKGSL